MANTPPRPRRSQRRHLARRDLLQSKIKNPKGAGAVAIGAFVAFPVFAILLLGNCGIMGGGCITNSELAIFGIPR